MFIKTVFDGTMSIVELAKFCGVAPCLILAANKCREDELLGRTIDLLISTPSMVRKLEWIYTPDLDGRLVKVYITDISTK